MMTAQPEPEKIRWTIDWRNSDVVDTGPGDPNDFPSRRRGNGPRKITIPERAEQVLKILEGFEGRYAVPYDVLQAGCFVSDRKVMDGIVDDLLKRQLIERHRNGGKGYFYTLAPIEMRLTLAEVEFSRYDGRFDHLSQDRAKRWYHSHAELSKARKRLYHQRHLAQEHQRAKAYAQTHRAQINAARRRWEQDPRVKEKLRAYRKKYYKKHSKKILKYQKKRREEIIARRNMTATT